MSAGRPLLPPFLAGSGATLQSCGTLSHIEQEALAAVGKTANWLSKRTPTRCQPGLQWQQCLEVACQQRSSHLVTSMGVAGVTGLERVGTAAAEAIPLKVPGQGPT